MALQDVKEYYLQTLAVYLETKENIADFEQALKDGYITEDKLDSVKEDLLKIKENVDRLSYIMFLFNQPKRKNKKIKYKQANEKLLAYFKRVCADKDAVIDENIQVLEHLQKEIKSFN